MSRIRPKRIWYVPKIYAHTLAQKGEVPEWSNGAVSKTVVPDLHLRRIVGWSVSDRMKRDLALRALQMAITLHQPEPGLIHHSDRGSQYCSTQYQMQLKRHGMIASMSGKGNCYDNAPVEAFFKTIKAELIWRH